MCIISTAQHANPKVIGHIEPCRAQFATLSKVDNTYSALFWGVSRLSWFEPVMAILVGGNDCSGCSAEADEGDAKFAGLEECICRRPRHAADRAANAALPVENAATFANDMVESG